MEQGKTISSEERLAQLGVRLVVLHGSRARGTARDDSDYDVGVLTVEGEGFRSVRHHGELLELLGALLSVSTDRVDVAYLDHANPLLLKRVADHGRLLFGDERDFQALKLKAFHRFVDYQPYFALERTLNTTAYAH